MACILYFSHTCLVPTMYSTLPTCCPEAKEDFGVLWYGVLGERLPSFDCLWCYGGAREILMRAALRSTLVARAMTAGSKVTHVWWENRGGPQLVVEERGAGMWAGPAKKENGPAQGNSNLFYLIKKISKRLESIWSKVALPILKKFQLKYGIDGLEIRNNFHYWSFSKLGIEFELKIKKV
jgi:hypothetical protein